MDRRRHIVHIAGSPMGTGVEIFILGLARSHALTAYRQSVIFLHSTEGALRGEFDRVAVSCRLVPPASVASWPVPVPSSRLREWFNQRLEPLTTARLRKALGDLRADLVHSHITPAVNMHAGAAQALGLPWVWTLHGLYNIQGRRLRHIRRAAQAARRGVARVVAVSEAARRHFESMAPERPGNVEVIFPGVEEQRLSEGGVRARSWRDEVNIPENAVIFGAAGTLDAAKAHEVLIDAAAQLPGDDGVSAYVAIAGEGELRTVLEQQVERLGLGSRVHFLGFQHDIARFLAGVDVFVMPSRSEGFGLALVEAMAWRIPVIATTVGGIPEIVGEHEGLLVPPNDVLALTQAMRELMDPARRRALGSAAQERAASFTMEECARRYAALYGELLDGKSAPDETEPSVFERAFT